MGDTRTMQTVISILSPQEQLVSLPSSVAREIIRIPFVYQTFLERPLSSNGRMRVCHRSITDILSVEVSNWAGFERTLAPLVNRLLNK